MQAAKSKGIFFNLLTTKFSLIITLSAKPPHLDKAITSSPILKFLTLLPMSKITPEISSPGVKGNGGVS